MSVCSEEEGSGHDSDGTGNESSGFIEALLLLLFGFLLAPSLLRVIKKM